LSVALFPRESARVVTCVNAELNASMNGFSGGTVILVFATINPPGPVIYVFVLGACKSRNARLPSAADEEEAPGTSANQYG